MPYDPASSEVQLLESSVTTASDRGNLEWTIGPGRRYDRIGMAKGS
jgi:hypothetical protein